jgi:hypothetical protein
MKTLSEQHDELLLTAIFAITETCRGYRANFAGEKFVKLQQKVTVKNETYSYVSWNEHTNEIHIWRNSDSAGWNSRHEVLNTSLMCEVADILTKKPDFEPTYFGTYLGD